MRCDDGWWCIWRSEDAGAIGMRRGRSFSVKSPGAIGRVCLFYEHDRMFSTARKGNKTYLLVLRVGLGRCG